MFRRIRRIRRSRKFSRGSKGRSFGHKVGTVVSEKDNSDITGTVIAVTTNGWNTVLLEDGSSKKYRSTALIVLDSELQKNKRSRSLKKSSTVTDIIEKPMSAEKSPAASETLVSVFSPPEVMFKVEEHRDIDVEHKELTPEEVAKIREADAKFREEMARRSLINDVSSKDFSVMLAHPYKKWKDSMVGWTIEEKLDGYRALYSRKDKKFYSRSGNEFIVPKWFIEDFPDIDMDGEITAGRGNFDKMGLLRRKKGNHDEEWKQMTYMVFDAPNHPGKFSERVRYLEVHLKNCKYAKVSKAIDVVRSEEQIFKKLKEMEAVGAEGLMLRNPDALYEHKRSHNLLKVKSMSDAEATVIGYKDGDGKYEDMLGSFVMKDNTTGAIFNLSGMTDAIRKKPHPIGTVITYKYFERDKKTGAPRFPSYFRVREPE